MCWALTAVKTDVECVMSENVILYPYGARTTFLPQCVFLILGGFCKEKEKGIKN